MGGIDVTQYIPGVIITKIKQCGRKIEGWDQPFDIAQCSLTIWGFENFK